MKKIFLCTVTAFFIGLCYQSNAQKLTNAETETTGTTQINRITPSFSVKLTGGGLLTSESSKVIILGGDIKTGNVLQGGIAVSYHFTPWWSAELSAQTAKQSLELKGADLSDLNIRGGSLSFGKVWTNPLTLSARCHFPLWNQLTPYAGIGITYLLFSGVNAGWMIEDISYKNVWGGTAMLGLDYKLQDHWFLNAEVRSRMVDRSSLDLNFSNIIPSGSQIPGQIRLNSTSCSIGIGYRF